MHNVIDLTIIWMIKYRAEHFLNHFCRSGDLLYYSLCQRKGNWKPVDENQGKHCAAHTPQMVMVMVMVTSILGKKQKFQSIKIEKNDFFHWALHSLGFDPLNMNVSW